MKLLVHTEQYNVIGILPSQLESLALVATAMGVTKTAFVDGTVDGVRRSFGFTRYASLQDFMDNEQGPFIACSPDKGEDIRTLNPSPDSWLLFGPSMGWANAPFDLWANIPGGVLNSRDAVPIALWETSKWREQ